MKASEVIKQIQKLIDINGDVDLLGIGHPGEVGGMPHSITCGNKIDIRHIEIKKLEEKAIFVVF